MARAILDSARSLPAENQRRVFDLIPPALVLLIESTSRMGWIPLEENLKLSDALHKVLGDPGFRNFFALTPQALLKWSSHGWEQSFRNSGKLVYQPIRETVDGGQVRMVLEGFPPELPRSGTFVESLAGTFDLYLRQVSKKGRVDIHCADRAKGRVEYDVSWD